MKRSLFLFLLTALIISFFLQSAIVHAADRERIDVLLYQIDKNINRQVEGVKLQDRLRNWNYNLENVDSNLDELLREVANLKASGVDLDLPRISAIMIALRERRKNFSIILDYRRILETFMKQLNDGNITNTGDLLNKFDRKTDNMRDSINKKEPLIALEHFDIIKRMGTLRENIEFSNISDTRKLIRKEWMKSRFVFKEYKQVIKDLETLRIQYKKIYLYSQDKGSEPGYIKKSHYKPKGKSPISFTPNWGNSSFIWRELRVGDTINPRIDNITGGSGNYNIRWLLDNSLIGTGRFASHRLRTPGMHFLMVRVTDSLGQSQYKSYVYNVRGGGRFDYRYNLSNYNPASGETVFFKVQDVRGGYPPYRFRWEVNGRYFGSGTYAHYQFPRSGTYNIRIIGRDSRGERREQTRRVNVGGSGNISFNLWSETNRPRLGQIVRFEFRDVSGGQSPYRYLWKTNTGAGGDTRNFSYGFRKPGVHNITVSVFDRLNRRTTRHYTYRVAGSSSPLRVRMRYSTDRPNMGQVVQLGISSVSGGSPPYRYEWFDDGRKFGDSASCQQVWRRTGRAKVTLKVTDSVGSYVKVHHNFYIGSGGSLSFEQWLSSTSIQAGGSVRMQARNIQGGRSPYRYRWEVNNNFVSNAQSLTHNFPRAGTYTVKLRVTDMNNLSRTHSRTVRVSGSGQNLHANFSWSTGSPKVGDTVTFRAYNVRGGNPPYRYLWKIDERVIGNQNTATYRFNQARSYKFYGEVRDSSGKYRKVNRIFNVGGSSSPISFNVSASNNSPRPNQVVNFSINNLRGGISPYSINWTMNGRNIGSGMRASYRFGGGTHTLAVTVRDNSGRSKSHTRRFNVTSEALKCSFSWSKSSPSLGEVVSFRVNNLRGGRPPYNVRWLMNGRQFISGTSGSYRFNSPGRFSMRAEVTDAGGNRKSTSHTFNIRGGISPQPQPSGKISCSMRVSKTNLRRGETAQFSLSQIRGGSPPYRITWTATGIGNFGSGMAASYLFNRSGSYTVIATVRDSRGKTKTIRVTITVR